MNSVSSIRVRNLRSFPMDTDYIPLKDINVFVGKNSSGKSTFARVFPLLRQSIEEKTKGPVLWFGNYVDFGDFGASVNASSGEGEIFFDFNLSLEKSEETVYEEFSDSGDLLDIVVAKNKYNISPSISMGVSSYLGATSASSLIVALGNSYVSIKIEGDKVVEFVAVNKKAGHEISFSKDYIVMSSGFLPRIVAQEKGGGSRVVFPSRKLPEVVEKMKDYLMGWHHKTKQPESVLDAVNSMGVLGVLEGFEYFKKAFSSNSQFVKNIKGKEGEIGEIVHLYNLCLHLPEVLREADATLRSLFLGVRYLGPVRASAERFYRYQDLQVDEIDHLGSNLPMVINSLAPSQQESLRVWMEENFGFSLIMDGNVSHYALLIKEEDENQYFNISDMGFGYSQILPIVVSVWLEKENITGKRVWNFSRRPIDALIVICRVPDDQIAYRSYPLLAARELLQQFIREQVHGHQAA